MENNLVPEGESRPWSTIKVRGQTVTYHHLDGEVLTAAINSLSVKQRMCCYWAGQGLTTAEIAARVSLEVTTIRTYFSQSPVFKDALYSCLANQQEFTTDFVRAMAQSEAPLALERIKAIAEQHIDDTTPAAKHGRS